MAEGMRGRPRAMRRCFQTHRIEAGAGRGKAAPRQFGRLQQLLAMECPPGRVAVVTSTSSSKPATPRKRESSDAVM